MKFVMIVISKGLFWRRIRDRVPFKAPSAAEAREIALRRFPKAINITLYQLMEEGEVREYLGQEYNRVWEWRSKSGWERVGYGHLFPLLEAPDELSDGDLHRRYLTSLKS